MNGHSVVFGQLVQKLEQITPNMFYSSKASKNNTHCVIDNRYMTWFLDVSAYLSCFVTACPFNESTLKLFVLAGKMRKATTVTSLPAACKIRMNTRR